MRRQDGRRADRRHPRSAPRPRSASASTRGAHVLGDRARDRLRSSSCSWSGCRRCAAVAGGGASGSRRRARVRAAAAQAAVAGAGRRRRQRSGARSSSRARPAPASTFWSALDADIIRDVLDTRFGTVHLFACGAFLGALRAVQRRAARVPALRPATVGATGLARTAAPRVARAGGAALFLGFIVISPALAGHASTQSPSALLIPDRRPARAGDERLDRRPGRAGRACCRRRRARSPPASGRGCWPLSSSRFSPLAFGVASCVLLATGIVQSIVHLGRARQPAHTAFGRAVLIKIGLLLVLIALGAYNQRRALPRLRAAAASGESPGRAGSCPAPLAAGRGRAAGRRARRDGRCW